MVWGGTLRYGAANSKTYFNGRASILSKSLFANAEYRPIESIRINAGGMIENDSINDSEFNPKLAVTNLLDHYTDFMLHTR